MMSVLTSALNFTTGISIFKLRFKNALILTTIGIMFHHKEELKNSGNKCSLTTM